MTHGDYQFHTLSNGIRLVHKYVKSEVAHCGILINAGTRDERDHESGLAHFIEHVLFKGTKKRKAYHILNHIENVGGDLNAYTTKEETCIYASFLKTYYDRSLDLFSDILFNSTFPEKELEKEKEVIVDEINSYRDTPAEEIYDEFEEIIFHDHKIGRRILGTKDSVKFLKREHVYDFIQRNYTPDQIIVSSVGQIDFDVLIKKVENYFGLYPLGQRVNGRYAFKNYYVTEKVTERNGYLSHCCIGNVAYSKDDPRRVGLALLNNLLGGPALNSRLSMTLREKHGYAYNVESNYMPYSDTGLFCIYLGTDDSTMDKSIKLVRKELHKLRNEELGVIQLKRAKEQFKGQVAISLESNLNEMLSMGKSVMHLGKVDTLAEIYYKIDGLNAKELLEIANEIFAEDSLSVLIYKS